MKDFKQYLTESKKTYEFKVKIAGDLPAECYEDLKSALEKFAIVSISKGKRTPIQEVPLDFPVLKNMPVTIYDLEITYPTTNEVLENYISQVLSYPLHCIKVVPANAPSEEYQLAMQQKKESKVLLQTEELESVDGQELVGQKRISSFLKDLAASTKTQTHSKQPKDNSAEAPQETASKSPVGSK